MSLQLGGGGGYGPPLERRPRRSPRDVASGRVSRRRAAPSYGVVLDRAGRPDLARTQARRAAMRAHGRRRSDDDRRMRLAVDIGGTFTDGVLIEDGTDRTWTHKVLTTPDDPSAGFIEVVDELVRNAGCKPADLVSVTHATTLTTNTLLQRRGARTALLVTAGFEDILEIGRQIRHELYDLQTNKPVPLVQRSWCHPIAERLDHRGRRR